MRRRVEAQPQTLTVWLPEEAAHADMERAIESARKTVTPEVKIAGQRYHRGRVKRPLR